MKTETIRALENLCNALDNQAGELQNRFCIDSQDVGIMKVATASLRDALAEETICNSHADAARGDPASGPVLTRPAAEGQPPNYA